MKVHKVFIAILFCNAFILAQEYNISLWTIPVARVEMNNKLGEIHFNTESVDQGKCGLDESDYFMENIIDESSVRQIWVEKNNNKRIIKASVKVYGFPIEAIIVK